MMSSPIATRRRHYRSNPLTHEEVREIKEQRAAGFTHAEIAKQYNVHKNYVTAITCGSKFPNIAPELTRPKRILKKPVKQVNEEAKAADEYRVAIQLLVSHAAYTTAIRNGSVVNSPPLIASSFREVKVAEVLSSMTGLSDSVRPLSIVEALALDGGRRVYFLELQLLQLPIVS